MMALQRRIGNIRMRPHVGNGNGSIVAVTEVIVELCVCQAGPTSENAWLRQLTMPNLVTTFSERTHKVGFV